MDLKIYKRGGLDYFVLFATVKNFESRPYTWSSTFYIWYSDKT